MIIVHKVSSVPVHPLWAAASAPALVVQQYHTANRSGQTGLTDEGSSIWCTCTDRRPERSMMVRLQDISFLSPK